MPLPNAAKTRPELRGAYLDEAREIDERHERLEVLALLAGEAPDGEDFVLIAPCYAEAKREPPHE